MQETATIPVSLRMRKLIRFTMKPTRVLLCNQHPIVRSGLRLLLERETAYRVIGEAANAREAVVLAEHTHPEVVLLDIKLPDINGIVAAREICSKDSNVGIVFVTAHVDQEYVSEAFKAGARGYVIADSVQSDLIRAIRVVARGDKFLSPSITSQLLEEYARKHVHDREQISEHEKQLFCLLAEGLDDHEIAAQLHTNVDSVKADCQSVKSMLLHVGIPELIWQAAPLADKHFNR